MSFPDEEFDELGELVAALCDGEITPSQAARLEELAGRSAAARRWLLQYVQLHGELYWEHAASIARDLPPPASSQQVVFPVSALGSASRSRRLVQVGAVVLAASVVVGLVSWAVVARRHTPPAAVTALVVAHLTRSVGAVWQGPPCIIDGSPLRAGQQLRLADGLAEITYTTGARVILAGPAHLELLSPREAVLRLGRLAVEVSASTPQFAIRTPGVAVVDRGTAFGVLVRPDTSSEVHVFAGMVMFRTEVPSGSGRWEQLSAGEAIKVAIFRPDAAPNVQRIAAEEHRFARSLPAFGSGSVAALRRLVGQHPRLIHHYTFEGLTPEAQRRDKRGNLDLTEAVMRGGRGGGEILYEFPGFDTTTRAIRPYRSTIDGNTNGIALQSEGVFQAPAALTVELLVSFATVRGREEAPIACAVATRADERRCGFLLVAAEQGRLVQLLDADYFWVEGIGEFAFLPDEWYYVACTFQSVGGGTRVNCYLANLTRGQRSLAWVVRDQVTPGLVPSSRLGIGKGFDGSTAHAYPWSGALDEVAIYDTVLDRATLERHLAALVHGEPR